MLAASDCDPTATSKLKLGPRKSRGALRPGPPSPPWDRAVHQITLARSVSARARRPNATLGVVLCSGTMRPKGPRPGAGLSRPLLVQTKPTNAQSRPKAGAVQGHSAVSTLIRRSKLGA